MIFYEVQMSEFLVIENIKMMIKGEKPNDYLEENNNYLTLNNYKLLKEIDFDILMDKPNTFQMLIPLSLFTATILLTFMYGDVGSKAILQTPVIPSFSKLYFHKNFRGKFLGNFLK